MRAATLGLLTLLELSALPAEGRAAPMNDPGSVKPPAAAAAETITLGGGCFWCLEAVFTEPKGVRSVESGYAGGKQAKPTYEEVCSGATGHAEVVQVTFDPGILSLHDLLSIFFTVHDPTSVNQQGADVGTQYRSVIFCRSDEQMAIARAVMKEVSAARIWNRPLVTQVAPFVAFYPAAGYHQRYYEQNRGQPYCRLVIEPKVRKFRETYQDRLARPSPTP
jgi:peptide-methionine (S)-S-oxide reductase